MSETNATNLFLQHDQRSIQTKEDVQRGFNEIKNDLIEFKIIVANCRNK
jgi:hypothetical protein